MRKSILIAILGILMAGSLFAGQPQGGDFVITRSTIDGGGGTSSGGVFSLTGTIGQPDANPQASIGGQYALAGGFWAHIAEMVFDLIFEDGFEQ